MAIEVRLDGTGIGLSKAELDSYIEASRGGFTKEQLSEAFDVVKDQDRWKNPIDAIVPRTMIAVLEKAIPWFTGTPADFEETQDPDKVRVTAPGYYAGPCN